MKILNLSLKQELTLKPFLCHCVLRSLIDRTAHVLPLSLSPALPLLTASMRSGTGSVGGNCQCFYLEMV